MNSYQQVMLDNLKEFIRVCEKHHLTYYLVTGSALGAIRHQGFIPWDDDIDVAMPRPDAEKLLKLKDEFKEPYFLQHYSTDPCFSYPFMKLRNSNTTYIENFFQFHKINHGIWIDIFILDGMSKTKTLKNKVKNPLMWPLIYLVFASNFYAKPHKKTFIIQFFLYLVSILLLPLRIGNWLIKAINRSMKKIKYEDAKLVGAYVLWGGNKEAMDKEIYGEGKVVKFEGIDVVVPALYNQYLTIRYGNYMKLPPENKRVGHHYNVGESTTISYKDFYKRK